MNSMPFGSTRHDRIFLYMKLYYCGLHLHCCRLEVNKGVGIDNIHYLNDGLWHMKQLKQ